jgi:hypothetical protein
MVEKGATMASTTNRQQAAQRVSYQLETLWDFNSFLFQDNLMPRLVRLGLISERIAPRYREIGLLE